LIVQKGYEQVRDGEAAPTIGETIAASRAVNAIERERLLADLDEERRRVRLLIAVLQEASPDALGSVTRSTSELSARPARGVVVLPEADVSDPAAVEERRAAVSAATSARPLRSPEADCFSTGDGSMQAVCRRPDDSEPRRESCGYIKDSSKPTPPKWGYIELAPVCRTVGCSDHAASAAAVWRDSNSAGLKFSIEECRRCGS